MRRKRTWASYLGDFGAPALAKLSRDHFQQEQPTRLTSRMEKRKTGSGDMTPSEGAIDRPARSSQLPPQAKWTMHVGDSAAPEKRIMLTSSKFSKVLLSRR